MNAKEEENYWRAHHHEQPFAKPEHSYDHYAAGYRTGYEGFEKNPEKKFDEMEADLAVDYEKHNADLPWNHARSAAQAAWDKLSGVISPRDVGRGVRYD